MEDYEGYTEWADSLDAMRYEDDREEAIRLADSMPRDTEATLALNWLNRTSN